MVKVIFHKEKKEDGTYPLALRITKNRKSPYNYLEYSVHPDDWDEKRQKVRKSHPNSTRLNLFLLKKLDKASDKALELEAQKNGCIQLCGKVTGKASSGIDVFCSDKGVS